MNSIAYFAGATLFFIIVFYWVYRQYSQYLENVAAGRLNEVDVDPKKLGALRLLLPLVRKSPLYDIAKNITWFDQSKKKMERTILSAGLSGQIDPHDIYGMRLFLSIFVPGFFVAMAVAKGEAIGIPTVLMAVGGWFVPSILLDGIKSRRQKDILLAFPFILDLLTLSTEAGLDFMGALSKVSEKAPPSPLVEEVNQVLKEIKLGSSRAEALRAMAYRVDMGEITSFVAILIANDQMGAGIGKVLRAQSDSVRSERFVRAEKAGARATQLMLFPLIFLILPAVFVMIFGPILVSFFYGGLK